MVQAVQRKDGWFSKWIGRIFIRDDSEENYSPHEVADFLEDNGFDVIISSDGRKRRTVWVHRVHFEGEGMDEGCRAADLAIQRGYPVLSVQKVWDYNGSDSPDDPYWKMTLAISKLRNHLAF